MATMTSRKTTIENEAERIAMKLIRDGLTTSDPALEPLCKRLQRFKPLLDRHKGTDDESARNLLRSGFRVVKFKVDPDATDEAESLRLLNGLADKLGGMASMMGL